MRIVPRILVVEELPQWVISSDTAAYHPRTRTIYLRADQGLGAFVHELGHHLIHLLGGRKRIQNGYDKISEALRRKRHRG